MNLQRKRRLVVISFLLLTLAAAAGFVLFALKQNINLFYTPTQLLRGEAPAAKVIRIGGMVPKGSVQHAKTGLTVSFEITDLATTVPVTYSGILPDLFREGQGVVVQGQWTTAGVFVANEVLAKHDEKYMPPQVAATLQTNKAKPS